MSKQKWDCIIVVGGEHCDGSIYSFNTEEELFAFQDGVHVGSTLLKVNGAATFTKEDLTEELKRSEPQIAKLIKEHLK